MIVWAVLMWRRESLLSHWCSLGLDLRSAWRVVCAGAAIAVLTVTAIFIMPVLMGESWLEVELYAFVLLLTAALAVLSAFRRAAVTRRLIIALAGLIAAAQIPAVWSWFHYGRLTDTPSFSPFTTHWVFSLPHILLGTVALWLAFSEFTFTRAKGTSDHLSA